MSGSESDCRIQNYCIIHNNIRVEVHTKFADFTQCEICAVAGKCIKSATEVKFFIFFRLDGFVTVLPR